MFHQPSPEQAELPVRVYCETRITRISLVQKKTMNLRLEINKGYNKTSMAVGRPWDREWNRVYNFSEICKINKFQKCQKLFKKFK